MSSRIAAAALLQLTDCTVHHDGAEAPLFSGVSLSIAPREIVALVGANGSGKTTLLRIALGLPAAGFERGSVFRRRGLVVAYSPQDDAPRDDTPQEGQAEVSGGEPDQRHLARWHAMFDLDDAVLRRETAVLSPGTRRKLALASVFARAAELVVLDEPQNDLDLTGIAAVEQAVCELRRRGRSALVVSHDRELIDRVADRTLLLAQGRLAATPGGYGAALAHQGRELAAVSHLASELRRKIRALEAEVRRRKGWAELKEKSKRGAGAAKPSIGKQAKQMAKRGKDVERRMERKLDELRAAEPGCRRRSTCASRPAKCGTARWRRSVE